MHGLCASQACLSLDTIDMQGLLQFGVLCKLNKAKVLLFQYQLKKEVKPQGTAGGPMPALCEL